MALQQTVTYSLVSLTAFQWTFSPKHVLNVNVNVFPSTILFANIDALIPQSASADFRRRGVSVGISDAYQFDSGAVFNTVVRYTNFYSSEHGQGPVGMAINPEGWGGNYFNTFEHNAKYRWKRCRVSNCPRNPGMAATNWKSAQIYCIDPLRGAASLAPLLYWRKTARLPRQ